MRFLFFSLHVSLICSASLGDPEEALLDWLASRGGQAHFTVARPCETCERGAVATTALDKGDILARVPANSSIALGPGNSAEQAYRLLQRFHVDAAFKADFGSFMAVLPGPEVLFTPEMYTDEDLAELQTPDLECLIRSKRNRVERLYQRNGPGPAGLSLEQLKHVAGVVSTRIFVLLGSQRLVPVLDMLNHSEEPNVEFDDDGREFLLLRAIKPIAKGDILTTAYRRDVLHRGDASLFLYGFLEEQEQPLLCAVDLPSFNSWNPWQRTPRSDPQVHVGSPSWIERWEYDRLAGRLASMPTTEWQDETLLRSGRVAGWKRRMLAQFRLQRKRALRLALEKMEQSWVAHQPNLMALCQVPGAYHPQGQAHSCAEQAQALQCPSGSGWGVLRLLSESAGALLFVVRAQLNLILPSLLFALLLFATVPPATAACVCMVVGAAIYLQLADSGIIRLELWPWY